MPRAWHEAAGWIVRESVTNVLRHSSASVVEFAYADGRLRIENDGAHRGRLRGRVRAARTARAPRRRSAPRWTRIRNADDRWTVAAQLPGTGPLERRERRRMSTPIRILLADDEHLIRTALAQMLDLEDDIERRRRGAERRPGGHPGGRAGPSTSPCSTCRCRGWTGSRSPSSSPSSFRACGCVIVTSHGRPGHLKRALAAGVRGFLPKTTSAVTLASVVRTVHAGGRHVDSELAAEAIAAGDSPLTPREADVLELAATGAPIDEIADRAALSPGTVRNYLSNAMTKLDAANRHEACRDRAPPRLDLSRRAAVDRVRRVEHGVALTNLDQPLFDGADATKRDLVDYLDAVARPDPRRAARPAAVGDPGAAGAGAVHAEEPAQVRAGLDRDASRLGRGVASARSPTRSATTARRCCWFANQRAVEYHPTLARPSAATGHAPRARPRPAGGRRRSPRRSRGRAARARRRSPTRASPAR